MIFRSKNEYAVSPVIGTILLVAIAVVLALIILAVVMGFSGDTNEKKVGLNAKPASGNDATLILYGGASLDELVRLEMIDQDSPNGEYVKFWDINENESAFVGLPYLAKNVAQPLESMEVYDTRINVRGTFRDGTEVILLVQPMTFYDAAGSSQDTDTQKQTIVSAVRAVTESGSITTLEFDYKDAASKPGWGRVYSRVKYSDKEFTSVPYTFVADSGNTADVGSYQRTSVYLEPGTLYEMYALLSTGDKGPVTDISSGGIAISAIEGTSLRGSVMSLKFDYANANADPTTGVIYYRKKGTDTYIPLYIYNTQNALSGSYEGTVTLEQGVTYEMYAGFHARSVSGGVTGPVTEITAGVTTVSEPKLISQTVTNSAWTNAVFQIDYESSNVDANSGRLTIIPLDGSGGYHYSVTAIGDAVSGTYEVSANFLRGRDYSIYGILGTGVEGPAIPFTPI